MTNDITAARDSGGRASNDTAEKRKVPRGHEKSLGTGTYWGPEPMDPADLQSVLPVVKSYDAADCLAYVWDADPTGHPHAFVQLVVGCAKHNIKHSGESTMSCSRVSEIKSFVPDAALRKLGPITKVGYGQVKEVIQIGQYGQRYENLSDDNASDDNVSDDPFEKIESGDWRSEDFGGDDFTSDGTKVILGPVVERLRDLGLGGLEPRSVAGAARSLVSKGDLSRVTQLFSKTTAAGAHAAAQTTGTGAAANAVGRRRGNEPNILSEGEPFATPPFARLSAYRGRFEPDLVRSDENTSCGILGHESRDRRTIEDISVARQEELLRREPLDWVPDKPVPTPVYEASVEWRSILESSKPLMAIYQLILTSTKRDENAATERICAGMPVACELVCAAFGYKPQPAWNEGLNAGIFLELYQSRVDSDLTWSDWSSEDDRARVILNHSIPHSIMNDYLEYDLSPEGTSDRTFLISGDKANSRDALGPEKRKRRREVNGNEPRIDPPETMLKMKNYLNNLSSRALTSGQYGILRDEKIAEMAERACAIEDEERVRQELLKVYGISCFRKPLYAGCDRSPRLRADAYNQLMNVKTQLRKGLYEESKDRELDASKCHLACYVPTVRAHGIGTPELDRHLQAELEDDTDLLAGGDLWMELAEACDTDVLTNVEALRGAVKRLYSVPYGMRFSQVLHEICSDYATYGGTYPDSHEPLAGLRSHPLVAELLETRETLREIVIEEHGLYDATGRFISLSAWNETKDREDRWRGLMSYINASYETEIIGAAFEEAIKEKERDARTRFKIWLYQGDGFTIRVSSKASAQAQVETLKQAVADKAEDLGVPTELEVDWPE